ncbi:MAG TPA: lipase secretion chaperone [Alcanivoracaceae bacterium]|nr:lipase secretion chaperone [Alcanivoracaceae bacterium]
MRRLMYVLTLLVALVVLLSLLPRGDKKAAQHSQPNAVLPAETALLKQPNSTANTHTQGYAKGTDSAEEHFVTGVENLPPSLQGTEVDGGFVLDEDGNLVITHHIRTLFDYFLTAQGEEPLSTILRRLRAYIHHTLEGEAALEAEALLDSYIGYLAAADEMDSTVVPGQRLDLDLLSEQKDRLAALRGEYFSAVANDAFFLEEDTYDRYTIARLKIMNDKQLSSAEKANQLSELRSQQPQALQETLQSINEYQDLRHLTGEWQAAGGDEKELRALRTKMVGEAATKRLEQLDAERAQWQQRVEQWMAEREKILSNQNLSEPDKQARIKTLREERFDGPERLRIQALERLP